MRNLLLTFGACLLGAGLTISGANAWQEPDNTKVNKRDRHQGATTADKAEKVPADRDLMQQIRKAVVDDDTLSMNAHNVKIIAKNGKVTLKGPVKTAEEKASIEAKAVAVAGEGNVTNQITVKGAKADHEKN